MRGLKAVPFCSDYLVLAKKTPHMSFQYSVQNFLIALKNVNDL